MLRSYGFRRINILPRHRADTHQYLLGDISGEEAPDPDPFKSISESELFSIDYRKDNSVINHK